MEVPKLNLESKETAIAEVDEMYTYTGSKKLLVNLDCHRQNGETIPRFCYRRQKPENSRKILEQNKTPQHAPDSKRLKDEKKVKMLFQESRNVGTVCFIIKALSKRDDSCT
ncbi:hypothetical protein Barb4_02387 [Bacteroidales bacterium Barb4]|nr:hypothetical protein Barb4_02387 [Bacteroidales bacterium Barb4]